MPSRRKAVEKVGGGTLRIYPGQDPDENIQESPALVGSRKYVAYETLERQVGVIGGYSRLVRSLGGKAVYNYTPKDATSKREIEAFDAALSMVLMDGMRTNWSQTKANFLESQLYGISLQRWFLERYMGGYRLSGVKRVPPSTIWGYDLDGMNLPESFQLRARYRTEVLPRWLTFYVVSGRGHEGVGALEGCAEYGLEYIQMRKNLSARVNRNLQAPPSLTAPASDIVDNTELVKAMRTAMSMRGRSMGVDMLLPSDVQESVRGDGITLAPAAKKYEQLHYPQVPVGDNNVLNDWERKMALSLDAHAMLLGSDGAGSLALSRTQVDILYQSITGALEASANEVERVLRLVWKFNGYRDMPVVSVDTSAWVTVEDLAAILAQVHGVDRMVYGEAVDEVLTKAGLPVPKEESE